MIGVATKGSRISTFISKLTKKEYRKLSFSQYRNACAICTRGYVVTCNKETPLFKSLASRKEEESFFQKLNIVVQRQFSTEEDHQSMNFIKISNETLESLSEYFDEIIEEVTHLPDADVSCGDGVLTIKFGKDYGTYVINRQVPNQQIWLSSPKSGPKRYDFIDGTWIYKHDGKSLHELLNDEIPEIVKVPVSFNKCSYSVREK